jgi:hypothetical protein
MSRIGFFGTWRIRCTLMEHRGHVPWYSMQKASEIDCAQVVPEASAVSTGHAAMGEPKYIH